jgi:hypothetical protein
MIALPLKALLDKTLGCFHEAPAKHMVGKEAEAGLR